MIEFLKHLLQQETVVVPIDIPVDPGKQFSEVDELPMQPAEIAVHRMKPLLGIDLVPEGVKVMDGAVSRPDGKSLADRPGNVTLGLEYGLFDFYPLGQAGGDGRG